MELRSAETEYVRFTYGVAGSGPAVVLLPGSGGWQLTFGDMLERLSATRTVFAVDPPGQGGTRVTDPGFGYSVEAVAEALAQLLAVLELGAVPVVGHSWGGGFALRLAQLYPFSVERLALLAPAGVVARDVWEFRVLRWPGVGELATRLTSAASVRHMLRKSFAHPGARPGRVAHPGSCKPPSAGTVAAARHAAHRARSRLEANRARFVRGRLPRANPLG